MALDNVITVQVSLLGRTVGYLDTGQEARLARAVVFAHDLDRLLLGSTEAPRCQRRLKSCGVDVEWDNELIRIERRGWEALCSAEAEAYYRQHMTEEALMAFPFGVMSREEALSAMADAEPWAHYEMEDPRIVPIGPDCGVVVYSVTAQRDGQAPFSAVLSSTFVRRDGEWKLAFHQQSFQ